MTVDIDKLKLKVQNKQTANVVLPTSDNDKFIIDNSQSAFELIPPLKQQFRDAGQLASITDEFEVNDKLFYVLERYDGSDTASFGESGVGYLSKEGDDFVFFRKRALQFSVANQEPDNVSVPQAAMVQDVTPQTKFLMVSVFPQNVRDVLLDPNVIPTCIGNAVVSPLHVAEDSLIGRFKHGLSSISLKDIFKKITTLTLTQLTLKSSKKPRDTEGSIVYDSTSKCLKFFDGKQWRTISYEDT
jgi:hypothetical protein